ncbi:OmpA family protein [Alphaproteobacteria bacterium]|nr:OmpA family protein [Alphaproteobacteria bacterium]
MLNYLRKKCHINLLFLVILLSNGCAYHSIEKLKSTSNNNNQFSQALSNAYLEFALYEMNEMHDEIDSSYFAEKGYKARIGQEVLPELINNWDIDIVFLDKVNNKRKELISTLSSNRAKDFPILSARTQLGFDCWLEQLEESWQKDHIKKCYDMMNTGLETLSQSNINHNKDIVEKTIIKKKNIKKVITEKEEIKEIKNIVNVDDKLKFEIYFAHNMYKLNNDIKYSIKKIYDNYLGTNNFTIEVIGHTDRSGSEQYNITLSKLRANSVKKYLKSLGIMEERISTFYFGEKKPKIITKDGIKEKGNRRVEIFVDKSLN